MAEPVKKNVPSLVQLVIVMLILDSAFALLGEGVGNVQNIAQNSPLDKTANKNVAVFGIIQRCVTHR